ncbi:GNAT family N-acetyltransferase [Halopenitus sp. POP-27]|uniref:GNAT family N-acetyltransferase n=1 Tax=Halopenitus sp. POP-27 TaxID=2994425 RepID=UPI0024684E10|nr:GNAT family N-acetyltransferase [Halopenitus sp. POP-27]
MDLRAATPNDVEAIRSVARASMNDSYGHAVSESVLSGSIDEWYDPSELAADVDSSRTVFPVAVDDGEVVGFAESYVVDRRERVGEIDWLHVHPDHRGAGIGHRLLARVEETLRDRDVDRIEGRVLAANESGTRFYEEEGYDHTGTEEITIDRETFRELIYTKRLDETHPTLESEPYTDADGETVYVDFEDSERGSTGPFFAAYRDPDHEDRYGYLCGNCEGLDVTVDTLDRLECADCGNRRKPTRWDAAYL